MKHITEVEAMVALAGKPVVYTHPTPIGTETIVGAIVPPVLVEEIEGVETVTHVTIEGTLVAVHIEGLPLPLEPEEPARAELVPLEAVEIYA